MKFSAVAAVSLFAASALARTAVLSSNYAGASLLAGESGYTSITGTIIVPTPSGDGKGKAWVAVDKDVCYAYLQAGISWTKTGSNVVYDAFYQWADQKSTGLTKRFSMASGDSVTITVTILSPTTGEITFHNLRTGKTGIYSYEQSANPPVAFCGSGAEWIVENIPGNPNPFPLTGIGNFDFTGASATQAGKTVGLENAAIINLKIGEDIVTNNIIPSPNTIQIRYA